MRKVAKKSRKFGTGVWESMLSEDCPRLQGERADGFSSMAFMARQAERSPGAVLCKRSQGPQLIRREPVIWSVSWMPSLVREASSPSVTSGHRQAPICSCPAISAQCHSLSSYSQNLFQASFTRKAAQCCKSDLLHDFARPLFSSFVNQG